MSNVEDQIVEMKFDNASFESGVSKSLSSLDKLKQSLTFTGATRGMENVEQAASRFSLNSMSGAASGISKSFIAMSTVAITAIANIVSRAVNAGIQIANSLTLAPIEAGLDVYQTKLQSIQTITANTGLSGKKGMDQITGALSDLNTYSNKTIYNFSEMAKNIGTFTAAGLDLKTSTEAIKGIANLAAISGSTSQQASTAMYQLSQALAAGQVKLQDWNSVVNAGMGGAVFQKALANTAVAMGKLKDTAVSTTGPMKTLSVNGESFRNSISSKNGESWLTSDVLSNALKNFTGDMTNAQLAAEGFNKEQIKAIQATAKTALNAATKVKNIGQLFAVLKETVATGWATTFENVFGNLKEAEGLFTGINNSVSGFINKSAAARNKVLADWKALGGRTVLIKGIRQAFEDVMKILSPIKKAFQSIFPPQTGRSLFNLTKGLNDLAKHLEISDETAKNIKRTFKGVFAIFDIGWQVIKKLVGVFFDLTDGTGKAAGGILDFTGNLGQWLTRLDKAIKNGDGLTKFFDGLKDVIKVPMALIGAFATAIYNLFDSFHVAGPDLDGVDKAMGRVGDRFSPLKRIVDGFSTAFGYFVDLMSRAGNAIEPAIHGIVKSFSGLGGAIEKGLSSGDFNGVFDIINTTLLGGIVLLIRNFFKKQAFGSLTGGLIGSIKDTFNTLTGSLKAMQTQIQAKTLLIIAGAIAGITASVVALSLIDSKALTKALSAMGVGFAELLSSLAVLTKIAGAGGIVKIPVMAAALVVLATAIDILSVAVVALSRLNWTQLTKGLVGVGVLLAEISAFSALTGDTSPAILAVGLAMIPLATGLTILAGAMKIMATMSWKVMAKGLVGIAGGLLVIGVAMDAMPLTLPITAAGMLLLAPALEAMAGVLITMATMSWKDMAKGFAGLAGGLLIIGAAMDLMPITLPITAAGMLLLVPALEGLAGVAKTLATMSWKEMGKAAAGLAGALLILAGGLTLMSGTLTGSASLLIAAGALAVLAPVLVVLGSLSWTSIVKGLVTLAGAFTILGIAGLVLAPISPVIALLAVSLLAVGAGLALAGVGALAFATAIGIFVAAGAAGISIVGAYIELLPQFMKALAEGILAFATGIAAGADQFTAAFVALLETLLDGIVKVLPKIGKVIETIMKTCLHIIRSAVPDFVNTGIVVFTAILTGLDKHIDQIMTVAGDLIAKFITGLGNQAPKITSAAAKTIVKFINGIADAIRNNQADLNKAGLNLASAIVSGLTGGLISSDALHKVEDAAKALAKAALDSAKNFLGIRSPSKEFEKIGKYVDEGFAVGIVGGMDSVKGAISKLKDEISTGISDIKGTISSEQKKIKDLTKAPGDNSKALAKAHKALAEAQKEEKELLAAQSAMNAQLKKHHDELDKLAKSYDKVTKKLNDAQDALTKAQQEKDDYEASIEAQYNTLPDISVSTNLKAYIQELQHSLADTKKFMADLDKLRAMGIDDETYKKLLAEGPSADAFIEQLLAAGPDAVNQINDLDAQMTAAAGDLGKDASASLYQAGIDAAQGIVNGLASQQGEIAKQMKKIAKAMIKAIKDELDSHSPSREMDKIGQFAGQGLAQGIDKTSKVVQASAEGMASNALDVIKTTMSKVGDAVSGNVDFNPTVTPVLDLTQLTKDASKISGLMDTAPIVASTSYDQANAVARQVEITQAGKDAPVAPDAPREIKLEQNNYSPKALGPVEIYRNTKNLLSLTKEALNA